MLMTPTVPDCAPFMALFQASLLTLHDIMVEE